MTLVEEADILAAIRKDPGDQLTRLKYADWLQDRDDPRAEGMRALALLLRTSCNGYSGDVSGTTRTIYRPAERWAPELQAAWFRGGPGIYGWFWLPDDWFDAMCRIAGQVLTAGRVSLFFPEGNSPDKPAFHQGDDAAALAWPDLSPEVRAEILAPVLS